MKKAKIKAKWVHVGYILRGGISQVEGDIVSGLIYTHL
jgi:hypothetical protein